MSIYMYSRIKKVMEAKNRRAAATATCCAVLHLFPTLLSKRYRLAINASAVLRDMISVRL